MKVLRTALFIAFLVICFTNVGYSQIGNPIHQINQPITVAETAPIEIQLNVDEIAYVLPSDPSYVVVKFDAVAPPNSIITIIEESTGTVLFTANLSDWNYPHAVIQMNVPDAEGTSLSCKVCAEDESIPCNERGCVIATDVDDETGGGGGD